MNLAAAPVRAPRAVAGRESQAGWPSGARTWLVAVVSLALAGKVLASRDLGPDSFYDLYAGRYISQHGIPHDNVVTVASHGAPWIDQQWLAQVTYYGVWAAGGYRALAALSAVLVSAGFAVLAMLMLRRGVPPVRMFAWSAVAFLACMGSMAIRAQDFGYPLLPLTLWLLLEDDRAQRLRARTWLVVPVLVIWANTHGSVLLGAGLTVLYAGYRVAKAVMRREHDAIAPYLSLGITAAACVACTPYGAGVLRYYGRFIGNPVLSRNVPEWSASSPLSSLSWAFFALALGTAVAVVVAWRRGARPGLLLGGLGLVLLAIALAAVRNQGWFAFGGTLLAADTLARSSAGRVPALSAGFGRATASALAALCAVSLGVLTMTTNGQFEANVPARAVGAAAALASRNPALRVLADEWSAPPLLWLHPATFGRVGFDVRFEQYSEAELSAYAGFLTARGPRWQRVTRGYGIIVICRPSHPQTAGALAKLPGWRVVYRDRDGLVLQRRAGP